ncbi:Hypothetical protein FKW44_002348 [Caligus rogercresseyi]|uniref:Uncharacterized protein n=1 Tax=Caligus rogercresseyi TaxID=217165 RepID=A0A7T8QW99_CALRO|nr:Hypothetical protein FKW44_002348 [Caligus rogercresseyi]
MSQRLQRSQQAWEEMDKTFEELLGRQSTEDEKLYGFHPSRKSLGPASKVIAKFQP